MAPENCGARITHHLRRVGEATTVSKRDFVTYLITACLTAVSAFGAVQFSIGRLEARVEQNTENVMKLDLEALRHRERAGHPPITERVNAVWGDVKVMKASWLDDDDVQRLRTEITYLRTAVVDLKVEMAKLNSR